ncbi:hypothetical protein [Staphylococcus felis]|uniref:hypothetical protein n=1 Tax=Staphylococcus felis TaxID=46127 RepID=UPI000E277F87|nr:hypothetical protein [Staphylococcus felis]REH75545.1 hypothetical protein DOS57_09765 [Staphylococcus felis]REI18042.1 hypothetical protein DOS73_00560 [Staphylococcus felis]
MKQLPLGFVIKLIILSLMVNFTINQLLPTATRTSSWLIEGFLTIVVLIVLTLLYFNIKTGRARPIPRQPLIYIFKLLILSMLVYFSVISLVHIQTGSMLGSIILGAITGLTTVILVTFFFSGTPPKRK